MKIIDAHIHASYIEVFADTAKLYAGVNYTPAGLIKECLACGVEKVIGMGVTETKTYQFPDNDADTPMDCDWPDASLLPFLAVCPGINPHRLGEAQIAKLEKTLSENRAAGIKIYAGYYHFLPDDPVYDPVYRLAQQYKKPVTLHSGDTFSEKGLLEYSRPLHVDRLASRWRDVDFIIAHMGDPWVMDACETAYKNVNVYIDLSGLVVGGEDEFSRVMNEPLLMNHFRQGLLYLNNFKKVLYGSDWPLASMANYIELVKALVPPNQYDTVFYENARKLYS